MLQIQPITGRNSSSIVPPTYQNQMKEQFACPDQYTIENSNIGALNKLTNIINLKASATNKQGLYRGSNAIKSTHGSLVPIG